MKNPAVCALGCLASLAAGGVALLRRYRPSPPRPPHTGHLQTGGDGCSAEDYGMIVQDETIDRIISANT